MTPVAESIGIVPNQPKTPMRSLRVPDDEWHAAQREARRRGETVTDAIRRALRDYADGPQDAADAVARVESLHKRGAEGSYNDHCEACECWWPCPTVRLLDGETLAEILADE